MLDSKPRKILVIDDEKDLVEDMISILEMEDYQVVSAGDGSEGLFKMNNQRFDAIITDLSMPKTDGVGVIDNIRKNSALAHLPIIVLSGDLESFKEKVVKFSNIYILEKPFKSNDLKSILRRALSKSAKELKLETVLIPEILKTAKATLEPLLMRLPIGKKFVQTNMDFDSGPKTFESACMTQQQFNVNSVDGSFYLFADKAIALEIGSIFGKEAGENASADEKSLEGLYFFTRAVSLKITKDFRGKKARVYSGIPTACSNIDHSMLSLIERTYRYGQLVFHFGENKFIFVYKYN